MKRVEQNDVESECLEEGTIATTSGDMRHMRGNVYQVIKSYVQHC